MSSWKSRQVRAALEKKGFKVDRQTDHTFFRFYYRGTATSVRTKVSFGEKSELHSSSVLAGQIQKQLGFPSRNLLGDFLSCPMSEEEYTTMLLHQGVIEE